MYDVGLLLRSFVWQWDYLQRWQPAKYKGLLIMFMSWQTAHPEPSPALPSTQGYVPLLPVIYHFSKAWWRGRSVKWAMRPLISRSRSSLFPFSAAGRVHYKWDVLSIALWPILPFWLWPSTHYTMTTWQRTLLTVRFPIHLDGGVEYK